jgi:lipopolysaccharide heptosyltransferase II
MRTSAKIFLDHVVGLPLALAANAAARLLGFVLRRPHDLDQAEVREIAVAKFAGMGSMIEALPLLRALKARFPQARIRFVTSIGCRPLVERMPYVDGGYYVDDRGLVRLGVSVVRALAALNRRRPDLYFDLEVYSRFASLMAIGSRAMNRYGFYRHSTWFKGGLYTYLIFFNARHPVRQVYLQMGRAAGIAADAPDQLEPILVRQEDRDRLAERNLLPPAGTAGPALVVINPNASDLLLERRWPADHVAELIEKVAATGRRIVLIGSPSEAAHVERVLALVKPEVRSGVINTAGRLSLAELFALLERADVVVTNDTGPMHMAVSLGRPTVCLFGPVSPSHYGFREANVAVLSHPVYCSPCVHEIEQPPCLGENECMRLIRPEEVLAAVEGLLGPGGAAVAAVAPQSETVAFEREQDGLPLGLVQRGTMRPGGRLLADSRKKTAP